MGTPGNISAASDESVCVGVVFGGPSAEHEVSAASALAVIRGLRGTRFRTVAIGVGKDGLWRLPSAETVEKATTTKHEGPAIQDRLTAEGPLVELRHGGRLVSAESPDTVIEQLDVVFPALHGPYGEDGVIQGYLEALGVPYVGAGVGASAVGMDKVAMRRAFAADGIPLVPGVWCTRRQWQHDKDPLETDGDLPWPRYVKPASMGSSIGVSRVDGPAELTDAVNQAFLYDDVVLVEEGINEARELLVGVIGDADEVEASVATERQVRGGLSDYDQKYVSGATVTAPAEVPDEVAAEVRELSIRAFRAIGGEGLARVDFLYDEAAGKVYIGEINTMPGFTGLSAFAKGWAASGLSWDRLLVRLIDLAFARQALARERARRLELAAEEAR